MKNSKDVYSAKIINNSKKAVSKVFNNNDNINEKVKAYESYSEIIKSLNESDNVSTRNAFDILKHEMENNNNSDEFNTLAKKVLDDYSRVLNSDISIEEKEKILDSEKQIFEKTLENEIKIQERNKQITNEALELDKRNKYNNWNKLKAASVVIIGIVGGIVGYKYIDKK